MRRSGVVLAAVAGLVLAACGDDQRVEAGQAGASNQGMAETASSRGTDNEATQAEFAVIEVINQKLAELPPDTEVHRTQWPDGTPLAEGFLNDGDPIGPWRYWHDNGVLAMRGTYLYGARKDGEWVTWSEEGVRTSQGDYRSGQQHGHWRYWYANGQPSMRGPYHLGDQHGEWQHWHTNGSQASRGEYIRSKRAGLWHFWDRRGRPKEPVDYHIPTAPFAHHSNPGPLD